MANEWIEWDGGISPVIKETLVDVQYRIGNTATALPAYRMDWWHHGLISDIIAYRLHQPETSSALQSQEGGDHYKKLTIQPMEYSMANKLDACQHTVVKYVTRFRDKGGIEDLKKAIHTIKLLAKLEYNEEL